MVPVSPRLFPFYPSAPNGADGHSPIQETRSLAVTGSAERAKILNEISDKNLLVDCELLAYALDNILYDVLNNN